MPRSLDSAIRRPERLAALRDSALLDTPTEEAFDRLTRLAARILHAPAALVSLVDEDRQFFKSRTGLPEPWASLGETPLSHSFCQHTVASGQPLIIQDAREHPLVFDNLAVAELQVVAYAGIPLITSDGQVLGSFCVLDDHPRSWSEEEIAILTDLAAAVMSEIELRAATREGQRQSAERHQLQVERDLLSSSEHEARMRAEASEVTLAAVVERVPAGIVLVDRDGKVVLINEAGRRISGEAPDGSLPILGQVDVHRLRELISGRLLQPEETPLGQALSGTVVEGREYVFQRAGDQADVWLQVSAVPLLNASEEIMGAVAVFTDITDRHLLERQKEAFLASLAHDLKTPLTSIKGFAQLLERRLAREETIDVQRTQRDVAQIVATSARMVAQIDELQDIARLQVGEALVLDLCITDLLALVEQVLDQYQAIIGEHTVILNASRAPVVGNWDPVRLERVVVNLLSNAAKYSPPGSCITLEIGNEQSPDGRFWALLSVSDQGVGIPQAELSRVFERFYRASNVHETTPGAGIGLAGVRQIIEQHGGAVTALSSEGAGATFTLRLPLDDTAPTAP